MNPFILDKIAFLTPIQIDITIINELEEIMKQKVYRTGNAHTEK